MGLQQTDQQCLQFSGSYEKKIFFQYNKKVEKYICKFMHRFEEASATFLIISFLNYCQKFVLDMSNEQFHKTQNGFEKLIFLK